MLRPCVSVTVTSAMKITQRIRERLNGGGLFSEWKLAGTLYRTLYSTHARLSSILALSLEAPSSESRDFTSRVLWAVVPIPRLSFPKKPASTMILIVKRKS